MTKKLTKRIISFMVTLAMVMVLLPTIPAMAAMDATSPATYLASQLDPTYSSGTQKGNNVTVEGNTVKLTNNLEVTANSATGQPWINVMCWSGDEITLDVGTHTLTLGEDLFIAPSTKDKTLKITGSGGKITKNGQYPAIDMQYGSTSLNVSGNITIENTYDKSTIVTDDGETKVAGVAIGATLNGGGNNQITIDGNDVTVKGVRALDIANGTDVTINGGTFTGSCTEDYCPIVVRRGEPAADGLPAVSNLTIKGGTIMGKPTGVAVWDGSTVSVEGGTISAEGTKGDKAYSGNGILVATTDGYEGTEKSTVNISNGAVTGEYAVLAYGEKAAVEISGGTVGGLNDGTESGVCAYDGASAEIKDSATVQGRYAAGAFGGGKLTVSGGTVTGKTAGIGTNGSDKDETTEITVKGGTITGETAGVYLPAGTMNVTAGTISGKAGIVVRGGDLDVQGGTITATGTDNVTIGDALDGSTGMRYSVPAAGITVDVADYPAQVDGQKRVTIGEGATIKATTTGGKTLAACKGTEAVVPSGGEKVSPDENPFSVSGGTFTTGTEGTTADSNVNQFLADGYGVGTGGKIEEKVENPEVKLNDVEYETLNKAIAAAGNGDTITLLKNVETSSYITINKTGALTIDLGEYSIIRTGVGCTVLNVTGGNLTVKGTTGGVKATETIEQNAGAMIKADGATAAITIESGKFALDKLHSVTAANGGSITIAGGEFTAELTSPKDNVAMAATGAGSKLIITGGTITGNDALVLADSGGEVKISGGTITQKAAHASDDSNAVTAIFSQNGGSDTPSKVIIEEGATIKTVRGIGVSNSGTNELTITGGTIEAKESAVYTNGSSNGTEPYNDKQTITISGGTLTSLEGTAMYLPGKGAEVTISGKDTVIKGAKTGIEVRSGKLTVEDGKITGGTAATETGKTPVGGGPVTSNAGIGIAPYEKQNIDLTVKGGTISGGTALYQSTPADGNDANFTFNVEGGTFEGVESAVSVDNDTLKASEFVKGGTFTKGADKTPDLSVYQYVGDEHAVDPEKGTVGATEAVPLTIIDFGYVEDIDTAGVDENGIFKSERGIEYNATAAQWTDATFYWCFNRALAADENVEITLTANGKTYTDTCEGNGVSPRYAASFLSNSQFGDEVSTNGVQIGDYTISGKITGGESGTVIEAATGVNPVNVENVPEQLSGNYAPVVVAATIADRTSEGTIKDVATDATATYVGTTPGESGKMIYNIIGTAKNLKKHLNGAASPTEGYWFGIEIKAPTGVGTEGADNTYKVTIDGEEAGSSTFDALPHIEKGEAKGAIIYFNVKGDDTDKHTVDIEWASGTTYTYSIDLTGVDLYGAASFVDGETDSYGFIAKGNNELLNGLAPLVKGAGEAWGTQIADCKDNTFYAAFKVDPANAEGKSYTVKFANEAGNSYSTTIDAATKGGIVYFTPAWQDGKTDNNIPTENYQGKYTVTVTKTGDKNPDATAEIKVYKIVYNAVNGKFGEATEQDSGLYAASVTEADTLTTTKPEVTPDDGFKAAEWGEGVASDEDYTITYTATCSEIEKYTVTCETATGGQVTADKTTDLAEGDTVTLTVTAEQGYSFESLTVKDSDNTEVETAQQADGTYTFTMPASNVTVTATFTADVVPTTYTVTIETATGGQVTADKTTDLAEGETVTLTVTADSGYSFGSLTVKDSDDTEVETTLQTDGTYTFTMPASNVTVTATFTAVEVPTTYTVTIETATGGKVEADKTDVAEGETVTLTVTPDSNYNFGSLTVKDADGTKVETTRQADGTYTFTMPASDVTVTATFSRKSTGGGRGGSGGGSASGGETSYSVSVPSKSNNGSVSANLKNATKGSKVTFTVTPDMGYMASGVTVKDANGNEIAVTDNGDGTYTFVMPDSKVSIAAEFVKKGTETTDTTPTPGAEENCPSEKFTDVDQSLWYHEGIDYALTNGLMNGMSDTTFEPNSTTTRAMVVAVLYRLDGSPATAQASFADVPADAWYADAVAWGEANGVVSGYSAETFGPSDSITREQMAAILYRYAQYKGVDVSAQADLSKYSDADVVSDWANTALSWANAEGLISGMSDTELAPTDTATRAQVASILMRFCENIVK